METSAILLKRRRRRRGFACSPLPVKIGKKKKLLTMMKELIKLVAARTNRVYGEKKPGRMME
jgi:hypothetical protein